MRFRLANPASANYLHPEAYLNNMKLIPVNSGTELVLGVGLVDSNGNLITSVQSGIVTGTKTVTTAGTAVRITATATPMQGIWVCADLLAGTIVTVGDSAVVGNASGMKGIILTPGNPPIFLALNDLSLIYVDAQNNGGKLSYAYVT